MAQPESKMEKNKYELRSNEVQEVMKSPPNRLIRWGNTVVVSLIVIAMLIANTFMLPVKVTLPFQISSIEFSTDKDSCLVGGMLGAQMPQSFSNGLKAIVRLDNLTMSKLGNLRVKTFKVGPYNKITFQLVARAQKWLLTDSENQVSLAPNMIGTIEVTIGEKSMLQLFWEKVVRA